MAEKTLRYKYDFMRFPMEDESNYEVVIRAEAPHAYDVYVFKGEPYSYTASILHYYIDLTRYTAEEIEEYLYSWGYATLEKFQEYLKEETVVRNFELRLATCITENDTFLRPETLLDGDFDECFDFLVEKLGGRSPLDESDEEHPEEERFKSKHDIGNW